MFRRLLFFVLCSTFLFWPAAQATVDDSPWQAAIHAIERSQKVAIGLSLRDASGKVLLEWRSRERFPLTSTVKALQCARVYDLGLEQIRAPIGSVAVVAHSPVYADSSPDTVISLKQACRAALSQSDNRAANFIFLHTGGPEALTRWMRQCGDNTTQSNRIEPQLNLSSANDTRDTTTPSNATLLWQRLDKTLSEKAHALWLSDLAANRTADNLFRAYLPEDWKLFDRSGASSDSFCSTRAIHALLVDNWGKRYYAAIHLRANARTKLADRDEILQKTILVVYDCLKQETRSEEKWIKSMEPSSKQRSTKISTFAIETSTSEYSTP